MYVPITKDLAFPEVPAVTATKASQLTDDDYRALVLYISAAEKLFDTIADREVFLETLNNSEITEPKL